MIWNEPNNKSHWDFDNDPDWAIFARMTRLAGEAIRAEAEDAIAQTGGRKFILANGCSVPDETDPALLYAAREIAEASGVPMLPG